MTTLTLRRPRRRIEREHLLAADDQLARLTAHRDGGRLRIDWKKLGDDERHDMLEWLPQARSLTGRPLARFEKLLERGCSLPADTFAAERKDAETAAKLAALAARARARPVSREAETSFFAEVAGQAARGALHTKHIGALTYLLASFADGSDPVGTSAHFETDADGTPVLVFPAGHGPFGRAGGGDLGDGWKLLQHLERNAWIRLDRSGPRVELRLGIRAKRVLATGAK